MKFGLDGVEVASLARPLHGAYESGFFAPTSVAVNGPRHGGNGDVWVADGYGESLVHRYSADGRYLSTLTGEECRWVASIAPMVCSSTAAVQLPNCGWPIEEIRGYRCTTPTAAGCGR